jgi:pteridine reductase
VVFTGDPARGPGAEERSWAVNYLGPVHLAREAAERMRNAQTPGAIVLISTMQAMALFPGSTAYAAPKAALLHAARILAKECRGPANIRVNVVSPGVTAAGMAEASIAAGKYDRFLQEGAIHRFGGAEDVARAVRFFLEPDNYVTGQALAVDGGLTL